MCGPWPRFVYLFKLRCAIVTFCKWVSSRLQVWGNFQQHDDVSSFLAIPHRTHKTKLKMRHVWDHEIMWREVAWNWRGQSQLSKRHNLHELFHRRGQCIHQVRSWLCWIHNHISSTSISKRPTTSDHKLSRLVMLELMAFGTSLYWGPDVLIK